MTSKKRPTLRFLRAHPLHWIALGLGSGLFPWMPGTVGALRGWLSSVLLERILAPAHWIALLIAGFVCNAMRRIRALPSFRYRQAAADSIFRAPFYRWVRHHV